MVVVIWRDRDAGSGGEREAAERAEAMGQGGASGNMVGLDASVGGCSGRRSGDMWRGGKQVSSANGRRAGRAILIILTDSEKVIGGVSITGRPDLQDGPMFLGEPALLVDGRPYGVVSGDERAIKVEGHISWVDDPMAEVRDVVEEVG